MQSKSFVRFKKTEDYVQSKRAFSTSAERGASNGKNIQVVSQSVKKCCHILARGMGNRNVYIDNLQKFRWTFELSRDAFGYFQYGNSGSGQFHGAVDSGNF